MKKWYGSVIVALMVISAWAGEQTIRSMYFSQGEIFNPSEKIVILKNASVDGTGQVFTISATNYVILNYTIPTGTSYYSTIIVGGELK